jgi:transposase
LVRWRCSIERRLVVEYVGIDWATRKASWCALDARGDVIGEGVVSADLDGVLRLVASAGVKVSAAIEMMSGAAWVAETLQAAGWRVQVADSRRARALAPLAAKTDKIDARVLAELARRDLVPAVWVPPFEDRALLEQLLRRMHLVRLRTSGKNRIFGILTQWGVRVPLNRLRKADGIALLERRGLPEVWRDSVSEALRAIDYLDERVVELDQLLRPLAREDERARLLATIPGVGPLLSLTIASAIGDIARFGSASQLVGYSGLVPRIHQSGESSRTGRLSKAGSPLLRWAAVEAAQHAWRPQNPWHRLYVDVRRRHGHGNAAKAAVARKVLIACWHVLARHEPFKPAAPRVAPIVPASSGQPLAA